MARRHALLRRAATVRSRSTARPRGPGIRREAARDDQHTEPYIAEAFIAPINLVLLGVYGAPDGSGNYDIYISFRNGAA